MPAVSPAARHEVVVPETLPETLALLNGCFNATAAVLLAVGYYQIRRRPRRWREHRALMLSAFVVSCLFLISYVTRFAMTGDVAFRGQGVVRPIYFTILISHVGLALVVVPLVLRTLFLALRKRFKEHHRIARIAFPVWMYVSVTGVIVYLMLYQWFPGPR